MQEIVYQLPRAVTDHSVDANYRIPDGRWVSLFLESNPFRVLSFRQLYKEEMDLIRPNLRKETVFEIVPGTPELVEKYARLDRKLKKMHGSMIDGVDLNFMGLVLSRLYEEYLTNPSKFTPQYVANRAAEFAGVKPAALS